MDPYTPPKEDSDGPPHSSLTRGQPCPACGSRNTAREELLHHKPGLLWFLMFGWLFLLVRSAFAVRTDSCRDCGEAFCYKTAGSWIAMLFLILFILLCALALM